MDTRKFAGWRRLGYALCNVGMGIGAVPANVLLLYYLTEVVGLQAGLAGVVVALPKLWDALVDPIFGGWVDQLAMRTGRRGPVTLAACGGYVATLVLVFSLPMIAAPSQYAVVATLLLIAFSTSQTAISVMQFARASEMSRTPLELSSLLSLSTVAAQILSVICSIAAPLLVVWAGGGATGYAHMAAELGALVAIAILLFVFATRQVPVRGRAAGIVDMSLLTSLRATSHNRSFFYLIAFVAFTNAGAAVIFGFLPFANRYVLGGDSKSLAVLEGVLGISVLVGMLFAPAFVKRFNLVASLRRCNMVVVAMMGLLFAASYGPLWGTWAVVSAIGLASGVIGVLVQTATISSTRTPLAGGVIVAIGFYLGIMLAGMKIGNSAGVFASGQLLSLIGFIPGGATQADNTLFWLRAGYTLLPMIFAFAAGLFLTRVLLPREQAASGHAPIASAA
jgi:GPH family glycoside/pentoside/hexuronide:cation symporter